MFARVLRSFRLSVLDSGTRIFSRSGFLAYCNGSPVFSTVSFMKHFITKCHKHEVNKALSLCTVLGESVTCLNVYLVSSRFTRLMIQATMNTKGIPVSQRQSADLSYPSPCFRTSSALPTQENPHPPTHTLQSCVIDYVLVKRSQCHMAAAG